MASNKGKKKTKKVTEENKISEVENVKIESKIEEKIEQKNEAETEKEVSEPKVRKVKKKNETRKIIRCFATCLDFR